MTGLLVIDRATVRRHLERRRCIALMREAMTALSEGRTRQLLRGIIDLDGGNAFGVMPGAWPGAGFGAKLVSVFPGNVQGGGQSHQGAILLFDPERGAPVALIHGGDVTAIRTACASAAATDALARADARYLAILGTGEQAWEHALALPLVRGIEAIRIWGRDAGKAAALAARVQAATGIAAAAVAAAGEAVADADIICTTSASPEPILFARDVRAGAHVNLVGSSRAGPVECDAALVVRSRYFADHRAGVLAQGAEYLVAREAGLVGEGHVLAEIGEVMNGSHPGRTGADEVTVYKSLGHVAQDLACAVFLEAAVRAAGEGCEVGFD